MGDLLEITTIRNHEPHFYKVTSSVLTFEVKARSGAFIGLAVSPHPHYEGIEIALNHNRYSWMRHHPPNHQPGIEIENILAPNEYKQFWLKWTAGCVRFGTGETRKPLFESNYDTQKLMYITFYNSYDPVQWKFVVAPTIPRPKFRPITGGELKWVQCDDVTQFPDEALIGGFENENVYIIRAFHAGALTPGKYVPSKQMGYVAWTGYAHQKSTFEVLCGFDCMWVPSSHDNIPPGAVVGGYSQNQQREKLYVGRAIHDDHLVPGKVQAAYSVCFIPYDGREIGKSHYEILVVPQANKPLLKLRTGQEQS